MLWPFVARVEQLDALQATLAQDRPGPLILKGEVGAGRSSLLAQAERFADPARDALLTLTPETFVSATELADRAGDRRPVIVLDDAHLARHEQLEALRQLHRTVGAVLLVSEPSDPAVVPSPSPVDHLRFEPAVQEVTVPPLTGNETGRLLTGMLGGEVEDATAAALHAATQGNPGLLHELLVRGGIAERMSRSDGKWQLAATAAGQETPEAGDGGVGASPVELSPRGRERLLQAVREAWEQLALDRLEVLCGLAVHNGQAREVAAICAGARLLGGRPEAGLRFLDSLGLEPAEEQAIPGLALARALLLALGQGQSEQACAVLDGSPAGPSAPVVRAQRAWISAMTGRSSEAARLLEDSTLFTDRGATAFAYAARGFVALAENDPGAAVWGFRRALVFAERIQPDVPWLSPVLTACLIDSLFLSGRISEATEVAAELHSAREGSGWDVNVSLASLSGLRWPSPVTATAAAQAS